jgi:hypothetical protein
MLLIKILSINAVLINTVLKVSASIKTLNKKFL